jgi:hypothetical protein
MRSPDPAAAGPPAGPVDRPACADARYTLPGDLNDLDAILDRYSDEETAEVRRILAARRAALVSRLTERSRGSA